MCILNNVIGIATSVIGASHIKNNICCQDSSGFFSSDRYAIAIVADGHGSSKHFRSERGSLYAVEASKNAIGELMTLGDRTLIKNKDEVLKQIIKHIIFLWNNKVEEDYSQHPFTDEELGILSDSEKDSVARDYVKAYGTTLLLTVLTDKYTFGLQIGDGECIIINSEGNVIKPIPEDERLVFNVTTSLCGKTAAQDFRFFWIDTPSKAGFLTTDGVRNSFANEDYFVTFAKTVLDDFSENETKESLAELEAFLSKLSMDGSSDDMSIAFWEVVSPESGEMKLEE